MDGLGAFSVCPCLPLGSCLGVVWVGWIEFFFDLGAELHHFHEESIGEGVVLWGWASEVFEHEVGAGFVVEECVAGVVEGCGVECLCGLSAQIWV